MNRLWPPGILFMIYLSIFSFSRTACPLSIRIGGGVESKLDLKSGGGLSISTVVTYESENGFTFLLKRQLNFLEVRRALEIV